MNYSKQREMLLNILRSSENHPTANDIYIEMRKHAPNISLGTVYRNLAMLTEMGTIIRLDTEQDSVHYDGRINPHYHFICNKCGKIIDLNIAPIDFDKQIEKEHGCNISSHMLIFYGTCNDCK